MAVNSLEDEPQEIIFDEFDLDSDSPPAYLPANVCACEKPFAEICYCDPEARAARERFERENKGIMEREQARHNIGYYDDEIPLSALLELMRKGEPFGMHVEGWKGR